MQRPTSRLIQPLLTVFLVAALAGCCGCLVPPGMGGAGARGPGGGEAGGQRWRDGPPPHWQAERGRAGPEGQRPRPHRDEPEDGPNDRP